MYNFSWNKCMFPDNFIAIHTHFASDLNFIFLWIFTPNRCYSSRKISLGT